jgi:hypothetical protein
VRQAPRAAALAAPRWGLAPVGRWADSSVSDPVMPPYIQPIVALIAGILILVQPKLLNYIVAIYLIVVGVLGLAKLY